MAMLSTETRTIIHEWIEDFQAAATVLAPDVDTNEWVSLLRRIDRTGAVTRTQAGLMIGRLRTMGAGGGGLAREYRAVDEALSALFPDLEVVAVG